MTIFHSLKIAEVIRETDDAISVEFEIPANLKNDYLFIQGQHLTLKTDVGGEELRRSYSICSAVGDDTLRVAIKQIDGGKFSTFANENLKAGISVDVMIPQGRFFTPLSANNKKSYLAVAAGSGITPIYSIIKTILQTEPNSKVALLYGNRRTSSVLFLEQLEDLKNTYGERLNLLHILSRESQDSEIFNGRIDKQKCLDLFEGPLANSQFDDAFLCGPEQMIMDAKEVLQKKGVLKENIHFELFITDASIAASKALENSSASISSGPKHTVKVVIDGRTSEVIIPEEGVSILDAALETDIDLPFACKGGVCSTCRAKVVQGKVRMDLNYALEDDEVAEGFVLTCQSHPLTDDVIVDFDA